MGGRSLHTDKGHKGARAGCPWSSLALLCGGGPPTSRLRTPHPPLTLYALRTSSSTPPSNVCTQSATASSSPAAAASGVVWAHYAIEAASVVSTADPTYYTGGTGTAPPSWVALSFAETPGVMYPALAVMGGINPSSGESGRKCEILHDRH